MAQVQAAVGIGEELVAENALVDFHAVLLGLTQLCFGRDLGLRRREAGHEGGGVVDQPLDAHELGAIVGQLVVERASVAAQEGEAGLARRLLQGLGGVVGGGIALGFGGQSRQLLGGVTPVGREGISVGREVAAGLDRR